MPNTKTAAEKLQEAIASDPFLAGEDVHLDLSSMPHLIPLDDATEETDEFAMPDRTSKGLGSADLKKFLADPDRESIAEMRDPDLLKRYDQERGDGTTVFARNVPFRIFLRDGRWRAKGETPDGTLHRFSDTTRDGVLAKVMEAVTESTVRELTPAERLMVVRLAQTGNTQDAIARYLEFAIGQDRASRYKNPNDMLGDPELAEIFDDAALVTWFASRSNVQDSKSWNTFLDDYAGGRPYTHALLDGAWAAFEKQQRTSALFSPARQAQTPASPREIEKGLEDLSDSDLEKTMNATKREFVRQALAHGR